MRKAITFLGAIIISFSMVGMVYAGDLNEHEKEILESAKETYEYKGESYRVSQHYLKLLGDYLMEDHIDINAEDKELILQMAFNNIELGVTNGYLFPIEDFDSQEEQRQTITKANEEEIIKELLESVGKDMSDIESYLPSTIDDESMYANPADIPSTKAIDASDNTPSTEDIDKDTDATANISSTETTAAITDMSSTEAIDTDITASMSSTKAIDTDATADTPSIEAIDKDTDTIANISSREAIIEIDNAYNKNSMEDEVINKTGFNLNNTIYTVIGLLVLMIFGIIIARKNNYFSNNTNEQKP